MSELPFGFERPEESPGFLLWQTTVSWQRKVKEELEEYGVAHSQFVIMALLLWLEGKGYEVTQVEIVNWSKLDKMTVSKALRKLEKEELVVRVESKEDTRAKNVRLSAKGKRLVRRLIPKVEGIDEEYFGVLSKRERGEFMKYLNKLSCD